MKIKKGDNVIVLTGKDKGKSGKVLKAFPKIQKVIVDGLNVVKRHKKPRSQGKKGEIVDVFSPIHVSNVSLSKVESKSKTTKKDK